MTDLLKTMENAVGSLTYAAAMLEAPIGSHMRTVIVELAEARKHVEAMLEALEAVDALIGGDDCSEALLVEAAISKAKGN